MIGLIAEALQAAFAAFERRDMAGYAHHTGRAGGVAATTGVYGIKALSLCDDISDAYETDDADFMAAILDEATERLDNPDAGAAITDAGKAISWPEYGSAPASGGRSERCRRQVAVCADDRIRGRFDVQ